MRDTKYILFLLARGKEREIAKEEDQCKKEQGSDYLKNQQSVYLCVPSGESGYLRGFLSIVTFVFHIYLILFPGIHTIFNENNGRKLPS